MPTGLQRVECDYLQSRFMRRFEYDQRRRGVLVRVLPAADADAPAVAWPEAGELVFGPGRGEVVAGGFAEPQELGGHDAADRVRAVIVLIGVAAPVAEEAGHGLDRTHFQWRAQDIHGIGAGSHTHMLSDGRQD